MFGNSVGALGRVLVACRIVVQHRRAGLDRFQRIGYIGKLFILNVDQIQRLLGDLRAVRSHGRDGFADVPDPVASKHRHVLHS